MREGEENLNDNMVDERRIFFSIQRVERVQTQHHGHSALHACSSLESPLLLARSPSIG